MIPATIIGGYLGSGKTTLINRILRRADGMRIAVMVNDFGELPIDADLIEGSDNNVISLAGGCICCAFGDNLARAVAEIIALKDPPDHIVIETSGVALPGATLSNLSLIQGIEPEGSVVLVDAETIIRQAKDPYVGDTIKHQIANAGLLIVSKADLVSIDQLAAVKNWLAETSPKAPILDIGSSAIPNSVILGAFLPNPGRPAGPAVHADFETLVLRPRPQDPQSLGGELSSARLGLVRAKGYALDENGNTHLIQVVGRRWTTSIVDATKEIGIVCIGLRGQIDREGLDKLLQLNCANGDAANR